MNKSLQNYDKIEKIIREGNMKSKPDDDYSLNSRKMIVSMIVYSSDKIPGIILSDDLKAKYTKLNELYTIMSKDLTESKKLLNSYAVMKLSVYLNKIMAEFGQDSKEYLIARMYVQITARDDFHLYIVDRLGKTTNKTRNFLVVPRTGSCTIVLNTYKTAFRYNTYKKEVDNELTTLIRNYIAKHNIQYDECLFREQLLGPFVKKMNDKIGIDGSINVIRHIVISDMLKNYPNMTPEQKLESAKQCMHSHLVHFDYGRLVAE